jgi:hypothetical protein
MKKPAFLSVFTLFFCFTAFAQISIIPKGGITYSNIIFEEKMDNQRAKIGLVGGVGINIPLSKEGFFSVQPEFLFIQKGYKSTFIFRAIDPNDPILGDNSYENTLILSYFELPVLAKVSFGNQILKAYVNAGPSVGFGLEGKGIIEDDNEKLETSLQFGKNQELKNRFDFGAQFGGGIGLKAGPGALLLDLRYGLGFSNLYKTSDTVSREDAKSQHRVFALTVGYSIPLGRKQ